MKKVVKVLSVVLMTIMVFMIFTACSKKDKKQNVKIGDIYTFGAYEQDNNTSNGKEAIEWIVVNKEGASVCLVSKYALDFQPYNTSLTDVTWENCSLREWLNDTFINDAFSSKEQAMIATTTVTADKNPYYDTNPGNNTRDKVFLLSITEADKYFSSDDVRMCVTTDYAGVQSSPESDAIITSGGFSCTWWLRSPGEGGNNKAIITSNGSFDHNCYGVNNLGLYVRPALWITLESMGESETTPRQNESGNDVSGEETHNNIEDIEIGDIYTFGAYEQDNNTSNGKEAIEWVVVDKEGASLCLLSKYALDCRPYNTLDTDVTWETCSLREWLNNTFINEAFSSEEQAMIVTTTVTADKNPNYDTNPGNNTRDKMFLLSIIEVGKYFSSDVVRRCAPTDYAIAQGTRTSVSHSTGDRAACYWWLRSPGGNSNYDAGVLSDGSVLGNGTLVCDNNGAVRPALWVTPEF